MKKITVVLASMLAAASIPALAETFPADLTCGERHVVTERLEIRFGEIQQGTGMVSTDRVLELWRSKEGSWTILMTRPDGQTCIMAAGDAWDDKDAIPGDPT